MKKMAAYYVDVEPSFYLLKEALVQRASREKILQIIEQKTIVSGLDSLFLKDAAEFLRLSILNLLAYKFLMSGNFLAWGKVTIYYSNFYSINCLLRLKGFAVIHLNFLDEKSLRIQVERVDLEHKYRFHRYKGRKSPHEYLWNKLSELYPKLGFTPSLGKLMIKDRVRWNYDLFLPSQSMADYAKKEARIRWENNFLYPNFGMYADPDAAEYYHDLMANIGYEEAGSGDLIKECINCLTEMARSSKYKSWYMSYFAELAQGIEDFGSQEETKREIKNWLNAAIDELSKD